MDFRSCKQANKDEQAGGQEKGKGQQCQVRKADEVVVAR
jgi:hypothetical protein